MSKTCMLFASALLALPVLVQAELKSIPLGPAANVSLLDGTEAGDGLGGWTDQGPDNCLNEFPTGSLSFAGIPFVVPDGARQAILLQGSKLKQMPASATVLTAEEIKATHLYVLATAVWGGNQPGKAATVTVHYHDGSHELLTLSYQRHLSGWWHPASVREALIAWQGQNGTGHPVGVYLAPLALKTSAGKTIRSIEITAAPESEPSLAILGLAAGDKPASEILPPEPAWEDWADNDMADWFALPVKYDSAKAPAYWEKAFTALDHRAGAKGWTRTEGEEFVFENGEKIRFHGITGTSFTPPAFMVTNYARILRKYGFNQVRFHSILDQLLIKKEGKSLPQFDAKKLALFDGFVAALKEQGIYTKASMHFSTLWHPDTGVLAAGQLEPLNNTYYFYDPAHQELYLRMLREFLAHTNAATGLTYAREPAFHMFKIVNESSMFFSTTDAVPGPYRLMLQERWNEWLRQKYGTDLALRQAWSVEGQPSALEREEKLTEGTVAALGIGSLAAAERRHAKRVPDQTRFYTELEQAWGKRVVDTFRAAGSKSLIQLSSWGGPGHLQELQSLSAASDLFDVHGKHGYWLHPHKGWTPSVVYFGNTSILKSADDNLLHMFWQHVAGKPFGVTEWNWCYPNDFVNEAGPLMAAYAALQNAGLTCRFNLQTPEVPAYINSIFDLFQQHGSLYVEPLSYFMHVRRDVATAPVIYQNVLDPERRHNAFWKRDQARNESGNRFYMKFDRQAVDNRAVLVGGVRLSGDAAQHPALQDIGAISSHIDQANDRVRSMTDELLWDNRNGTLQVMTPRTRAFMGFFGNREVRDEVLHLKLNDAYGVVGFASLDNQPLEKSGDILVCLVGRQRNAGQSYRYFNTHGTPGYDPEEAYTLKEQGSQPVMMEPATADFAMKTERTGGSWKLLPLDLQGQPKPASAQPLAVKNGRVSGRLSNKEFQSCNFALIHTP